MATMPTTFVGTDVWNAELYGSLSLASRLSGALTRHIAPLRLTYCFWQLNKVISSFTETIDKIMEAAQDGNLPAASEPVDVERLNNSIDSLLRLHYTLDEIHRRALQRRLNNYSILASGIAKLRYNDERIEELAHWLMDMQHPEEFEAIFDRAAVSLESGETVSISD